METVIEIAIDEIERKLEKISNMIKNLSFMDENNIFLNKDRLEYQIIYDAYKIASEYLQKRYNKGERRLIK